MPLPSVLMAQWPLLIPAILFIAYLYFRNKPARKELADTFFHEFRVGGHRGSPTKCPENTISSMERAHAEGADLIEFDVSLTKDGVAVLLHDDTLDRTTNLSGPIRQFLHKELVNCNAAAKFVGGEGLITQQVMPLPTLDEIVEWAKSKGVKMLFDVKDSDQMLVDKLEELFTKHNISSSSIVCSFHASVIWRIKRHNPSNILTGLTWRRWMLSYEDCMATRRRFPHSAIKHFAALVIDVIHVWCIHRWLPSFLGVDLILTEHSEISESYVRYHETCGRKVCAWTVNDIAEMVWMRKILHIPFLTDVPHMAKLVD